MEEGVDKYSVGQLVQLLEMCDVHKLSLSDQHSQTFIAAKLLHSIVEHGHKYHYFPCGNEGWFYF
jgi:hypothetical protein